MEVSRYAHVLQLGLGLAAVYIAYILFTSLTLWRSRRALQQAKGTLPVVTLPQKDPILGWDLFTANMAALKEGRFLDLAKSRFDNLGVNTFSLNALGRHLIATIEPENLKTIQATEFKKWGLGTSRKVSFIPLLGVGIFTTDGAEWQHSRDMLRPNFVRSQIGDIDTLDRHTQHLIEAIPKDGSMVNLSDLFFRLTIDSATEMLFGESTESLTKNSTDGFADAFNNGQDYIANNNRWGFLARFFPANSRFKKDSKFVHDFVDYYVYKGLAKRNQLLAEKANNESSGRYLFIEELVRQTNDPVRIRSELLNILLAGRDTTASLLTNVWYILAHRPDIWAKLQAEIAELDGAKPSFEQMKNLKYLKALLNESLRVHPVVPANSREALEDTTLPVGGGPDGRSPMFVKKGQVVAWNVYTMHRRKDFYGEDALEFRPERWIDDPVTGKKGLRPGWEYLPFNGGARICLGQQLALTEASYATVRLCQTFSGIESRDPQPWIEGLTLTCVSKNGAKVALTPRKE